ncbi:NAD(P)/FAD-dependent oxidoreductase [Loktanella sp. S4079]|uniref:NAD(P)/FAD-dependent oxidoreductase n=1 Tax=Loktanella sp. S4079 TaxID=579483 RepID=UPI0005FA380C|nr:NAD(P)/FAD-dependent oxidoreductase [Loktanella sp. S4079]KJZ20318.1 thioredoxin reductase [Loktanella sp. S4079]
MTHDVIVIGGSYAGMAAALQLLRAHRKVVIIDTGERRNRFAPHAQGFLSQDGVDPAQIAATAKAQLEHYPTLTWVNAKAVDASGTIDSFTVTTDAGTQYSARRIILATGVSDKLPEIEGLKERWGRHVFHCPYCHGYELNKGKIGVIATGEMSIHQARLIPEWGDVTFFLNDALVLDKETLTQLNARGVQIETTPIARLSGNADVVLTDGRSLSFAGLFTASTNAPASPIVDKLGCQIVETGFGTMIQTDEGKATNIPGVYACGDVARVPHSVSLAVGDGAWAGAQVHASLVFG